MTRQEKASHWIEISNYDIDTGKVMYAAGRYTYVAFMCQQSIEKAVKALYIYAFDEETQRTHNINIIFNKILESSYELSVPTAAVKQKYLQRYQELFQKLLAYYIESRYTDYKEKISKLVDKNEAERLLKECEECLIWIISLMKLEK